MTHGSASLMSIALYTREKTSQLHHMHFNIKWHTSCLPSFCQHRLENITAIYCQISIAYAASIVVTMLYDLLAFWTICCLKGILLATCHIILIICDAMMLGGKESIRPVQSDNSNISICHFITITNLPTFCSSGPSVSTSNLPLESSISVTNCQFDKSIQ